MVPRSAERRGRPRRHFPRDGQRPGSHGDLRLRARTIRGASRRSAPCKSYWWWAPRAPIANRACRRFGIPRSPRSPCRRPATRFRATHRPARSIGCKAQQLLDEPGDWRVRRPASGRRRMGVSIRERLSIRILTTPPWWPGLCTRRAIPREYAESVRRALDWLVGMQSRNGGFAAFDADNTCYYLNKIPFADHGALAGSAHQRCDGAGRYGARAHRQAPGQGAH